jgi:diguanylate cyclase (GGDEF)-like protein
MNMIADHRHGINPGLGLAALGRLMPMFLWVGAGGEIRAIGPTLAKLCGGEAGLRAQPLAAHFTITSAQCFVAPGDLRELPGKRLHLALRNAPATVLRGLAVAVGDAGEQGVLLNLSFGVGIAEAVRRHAMTDADFAATDLAMELLYLQEAKAAVMGELHALNTRLESARRAAEAQAMSDPLTGLANRRALEAELERAAAAAMRGGSFFSLAHLDLDHFKEVNDQLGHAAGDFVLASVADCVRRNLRRGDSVARVGGDEFVLLLHDLVDPVKLDSLFRRLIARLEEPMPFEGALCRISASIGVVMSTSYAAPEPRRMLVDADAALYEAKHQGRGRCIVVTPIADVPTGSGESMAKD